MPAADSRIDAPSPLSAPWRSRAAPWGALLLAVAAIVAVTVFVDVSPRVEGDFFFADDDPQVLASARVRERFPAGEQVILRVEDLLGDSAGYRTAVAALGDELERLDPVRSVYSIATQDAQRSPLFGRVLLTGDPRATNLVLDVDAGDPETLLTAIEDVVAGTDPREISVMISGVPAIVEMIRRSLDRDLLVFSASALLVFALLIGTVYRDAAIVLGMMATCAVAVAATLLTVRALDVPIGLLTANLVTIVFVLTLSHIVFLTANWSHAVRSGLGREVALESGVRRTLEPSFWSMATTLLGFVSLLVATARPLRELGVAGAVGAVTALVVAFAIYPAFLARWARIREPRASSPAPAGRGARWGVAVAGVLVLVMATGIPRVDTDPTLLSYFAPGSELRRGLEAIDAEGGTSTLDVVVRDPAGARIDALGVFARLGELQEALEADPAVGVVISPTVLIAHARTVPLAGFLPVSMLLDLASSEMLGGVGLSYATSDREQARYSLRLHEGRAEDRRSVIARIEEQVERAGLETVEVAGLYDLQAQLGDLIRSSLRIGIGGLLLLFLAIGWIVSRSVSVALRMWVCLAAVPAVVLGVFGHLGVAVDIITSPAANIALAIGADSMIHLATRARTLSASGAARPWVEAVVQIRGPVLGATAIIAAGFGIFVLSSFPPTGRFGLAVILGTTTAAAMAVAVLPRLVRAVDGAP